MKSHFRIKFFAWQLAALCAFSIGNAVGADNNASLFSQGVGLLKDKHYSESVA